MHVPAVSDLKSDGSLLDVRVDDRAARPGVRGLKKDRDPHPCQDMHARGSRSEARAFRRWELLDEHAVGLLGFRERRHGSDADLAFLAGLECQEPREDDDVVVRRELHLAAGPLRPAVRRQLEPEGLVALVGNRQEPARARRREREPDRGNPEGRRPRDPGREEAEREKTGDASGFASTAQGQKFTVATTVSV